MTTSLSRNETAAWLREQDNYLILTHRRPDGDTLGSAATLCRGLRKLGKQAWVLNNSDAPLLLVNLIDGLTVEEAEENHTVISVDVAAPDLLPETSQALLPRLAFRIDHHHSRENFSLLELVDSHAAACGEIIYDLLQELGIALDQDMAKALYAAVSTDTGCFRYANTTAHTYLTAAACAATGADLYPMTQELFDTNSVGKLKMQSWILEHAEFFCDGQAAVCAIPKEVEMTVTKADMESVSGFLRSIEGVKMAATLRVADDGRTKISVRAVPGYDASIVCGKFGGGGHKGASGASLPQPLEEAKTLVRAAIEERFS